VGEKETGKTGKPVRGEEKVGKLKFPQNGGESISEKRSCLNVLGFGAFSTGKGNKKRKKGKSKHTWGWAGKEQVVGQSHMGDEKRSCSAGKNADLKGNPRGLWVEVVETKKERGGVGGGGPTGGQ